MDMTFLKTIGDNLGIYLSKGITFLSNTAPSKIIGILMLATVGYFVLKLIEKGIKYAIIALVIFLIISLGYSLI